MTKNCSYNKEILLAYLDKTLLESEKQAFLAHLQDCPSCRQLVSCQEDYLALLASSQPAQRPDQAADLAALKSSIMAGIQSQKQQKFWHKPVFWLQSTAVLAAVLVAVFIIPALLPVSRSHQMYEDEMDLLAEALSLADDHKTTNNKAMTTTASAWSFYKGSLAELPAMACFFSDTAQTEASSTGSEDFDNQDETAAPSSEADLFATCYTRLNEAGRALFGLLEQAEDMRVIVKQEKPARTMILAAFTTKQIAGKIGDLQDKLAKSGACQLETVAAQDLVARLEQVEIGLYGQVFADAPASSLSWLLITLGSD